ncbi:AAA family ATPase [Streptomyces sp. NPDC001102]
MGQGSPSSARQGASDASSIYDALVDVIGQENGKRDLATLLAMHMQGQAKRPINPAHTAPNALIIGPTGVGKTHAIRTASAALELPLAIVDATRLATSAYGDELLDEVLIDLLRASRSRPAQQVRQQPLLDTADMSELEEVSYAEQGIVFIDEFDKLASDARGRNDRNELVQRRLLQFIDGTRVSLRPGNHVGDDELPFDTAGVLFLVAGAFTDLLEDLGGRPHEVMRGMVHHDHVISQDLVRYGFMPELIARIPVIIEFSALSEEELVGIMRNKATDPSQFYMMYLRSLGVELSIDEEAQYWIATAAAKLKIGARGLHQVLFPLLSLLSQEVEHIIPRPASIHLDKKTAQELAWRAEYRRNGRSEY